MRPTEKLAKSVVEAYLPGSRMEYRFEQSHGEYDFDLHYADGMSAAVEVTEAVDEGQRLIWNKILSEREGGQTIEAKKCKKSWMIVPRKDSRIAKIRARADDYLSILEEETVENFACWLPMTHTVESVCRELLLEHGRTISLTGPPRIWILLPGEGGAVGPSVAIASAEKEAYENDNRKKLGVAGTRQRHLVVYVDVTNGLPWVALTDFEPPPTLPDLPQEITDIWLIGPIGEQDKREFVVWRASKQEIWHRQRVSITDAVPGLITTAPPAPAP